METNNLRTTLLYSTRQPHLPQQLDAMPLERKQKSDTSQCHTLAKGKTIKDIEMREKMRCQKLALRRDYYNHVLRQAAYLFNKVIFCFHEHAAMFVQVYANLFIGKRIMNI